MDTSFSSIIRISNVSDYVAPSKACILPLKKSTLPDAGVVGLRKRISAKNQNPSDKSKVILSLNDCLACNGCITSAETILIQEQSIEKIIKGLSKCVLGVVTVSPQAICSIAVKRGMTPAETSKKIAKIFKNIGAKYVLDSSIARYLSLMLSYEELKARKGAGTIFSSVCPGFVCFAEKTHGDLLIPHLSRVRSPQAIMGSLVKNYLAKINSMSDADILHVSIMPCFDKKLEASRSEFGTDVPQVDCVISTNEAEEILERFFDDLPGKAEKISTSSISWLNSLENGNIIGACSGPNYEAVESTSGGYAEYVVARFVEEEPCKNLEVRKLLRFKDLEVLEVFDCDDADKILLTVAKCYGFRNIQNIVLKLKRQKCSFDYVEIMACPSGCANGGGQIRAPISDDRSSVLKLVEQEYRNLKPNTEMEAEIHRIKCDWEKMTDDLASLLQTDYRKVDKNIMDFLNINW